MEREERGAGEDVDARDIGIVRWGERWRANKEGLENT